MLVRRRVLAVAREILLVAVARRRSALVQHLWAGSLHRLRRRLRGQAVLEGPRRATAVAQHVLLALLPLGQMLDGVHLHDAVQGRHAVLARGVREAAPDALLEGRAPLLQ
eukprot:5781432-Alexandrium_andersonii.AAC.1